MNAMSHKYGCDNIFRNSRSGDGSCGALDYDGDRSQTLKLYRASKSKERQIISAYKKRKKEKSMSPTREEYIAELKSKYRKTGFITTHLMLEALLHKRLNKMDACDEKITKTIETLNEFVGKFNVNIWPFIRAKNAKETRYTTFRFATDSIEFITRITAGRILMTVSPIKGDYRFVSLLGCEDENSDSRCGLQGVGGTDCDLCSLLETLLMTFKIDQYEVYTSDGVYIA